MTEETEMKKLLLLVNPVAGRSSIQGHIINVIDTFVKADFDVTVVTTQSEAHLIKTVEDRCEEFDVVVCTGGDGTLNIVVNTICRSGKKATLGYIPCGTTNDFAKTRGISSVPELAAEQIAYGSVHSIDVGFFGGKAYIYVAAFGVFSDTSYATPRQLKQDIGRAAYLLEGVKSFVTKSDYHVKFEINGEVLEGDFMYGMCSNTTRIGGFDLPLISGFSIDDGMIDVTLVKSAKKPDDNTKLLNALITQQADDKMIYQFRTSRLTYECNTEIPWSLDGEFGGAHKTQTIEIKSGLIDMLY